MLKDTSHAGKRVVGSAVIKYNRGSKNGSWSDSKTLDSKLMA